MAVERGYDVTKPYTSRARKTGIGRPQHRNEAEFRYRVANVLSHEPYCHRVYFHEGDYENKFSVHKVRGYVDLYVVTNEAWEHHSKFPVIGIETKLAVDLGWVRSTIRQIDKYVRARNEAEYRINGEKVPPPTIFLICTDDSFYEGQVFLWKPPDLTDEHERRGAWKAITEFLDRELWEVGAAILRRNYFMTNMFGNHGGPTRYDLY